MVPKHSLTRLFRIFEFPPRNEQAQIQDAVQTSTKTATVQLSGMSTTSRTFMNKNHDIKQIPYANIMQQA